MKKAKPNTPKLYIPDADKKLKDMCQDCYLFGSGETNNTACFWDWVTPFGYMGYVK